MAKGGSIVGLDVAYTNHGIVAVEQRPVPAAPPALHILEAQQIETPNYGTSPYKKLAKIQYNVDVIAQIVMGLNPQAVFIEDFAYNKHGSSMLEQAGTGYLLRSYFFYEEVPCYVVAPTQLKKFVAGKGNADKTAVAIGLVKRWGLEFNTDDLRDAAVLALIGYYLIHKPHCAAAPIAPNVPTLVKDQVEIINAIEAEWRLHNVGPKGN